MNKKNNLVELKYQSEAANDMGILGLIRILRVSIIYNKRHGISGVLFFQNGRFGQILEGPRTEIEKIWAKIQKDPRHHKINLLGITEITERKFSGWSLKLFEDQELANHLPQLANSISNINEKYREVSQTMESIGFGS